MRFWSWLIGQQDVEPETRAIDTVPWAQGGSTSDVVTQDRALSLAPVFAANRQIAGTISTLPLDGYRKLGDRREPMGSLPLLFALLDQGGELVPWVHRALTSLVLRGNAVGLITSRDGFGFPTRIDWLNPGDVYVDDSRSVITPSWYWLGREVPRENVVHIPWFPVAGQVWGLSPIGAFRELIGMGLDTQTYSSTWFGNGGFPPGVFKNEEQTIPQGDAEKIKGRLRAAIRTREPLVHGRDWTYTPISVPPEEAQFIEATRLNASQVAAIYGLPPEDIGGSRGDSLTYATVELNQLDRQLSLRPWMVLLERKFASLLPERQYVRFNADAMVRTDVKTRWEVHQIAVAMGARSINEVRALEDLPPLPPGQGGDDFNTPSAQAEQQPAPEPPVQDDQPPAPAGQRRRWGAA